MSPARTLGTVDDLHSFSVALEAYGGTALLVTPPEPPEAADRAPAAQTAASSASSAARR